MVVPMAAFGEEVRQRLAIVAAVSWEQPVEERGRTVVAFSERPP